MGLILFLSRIAAAETTSFLHSNGAVCTAGPSSGATLFTLDPVSPTATQAKCRDSASVNRTTFKEIGTWSAAPATQAQTLSALSDLHAWIGLKNSDDIGTNFDLRVELYKNGVLIASGVTQNIQGVTRNPNLAKEVTVAFGAVSDAQVQSGDILSIKILTKVTAQGGHNNAVGLRLYYDATARPSQFGIAFLSVSDLAQGRSGHTATLLADGNVLITGGRGPAGVLSSAELFDSTLRNSRLLTQSLTTPRVDHTATLLPQTDSLLIAGEDSVGFLMTTELFHPATEIFQAIPPTVQILRSGHTSTPLREGRILILGGVDASRIPLSAGEQMNPQPLPTSGTLYDPQTATFTLLPNALLAARSDHTATLLPSGEVLVVGGRNDSGELASAELFNPQTGASQMLAATLNSPRAEHTAALRPDGTVLIVGGRSGGAFLGSQEIYDPATQAFIPGSSTLQTPRANQTATLLPTGEILVAGGEGANGILATTELIPPLADTVSPQVVAILPADGEVDVPLNSLVSVLFSEPINVKTVTPSTIQLSAPTGPVTGTVGAGESGLLAFFVPQSALPPGTTYTLTLDGITDLAGNSLGVVTRTFTTVFQPTITSFSPGSGPIGALVTIVGEHFGPTVTDNVVKINDVEAPVTSATATGLILLVPAGATTGPITVTTPGGTAAGAVNFTVTTGPTITEVSPTSGDIGTAVTLTGANFDPTPSNNKLFFNGKAAIITSATTTQINTTVPQGATTGPVTVNTPLGVAVSPAPFTVVPSFDFNLGAAPAALSLLQGASAAAVLSVTSTGAALFTGLASLTVSGLPAGVTALFEPPQVTSGQQSVLRIAAGSAVPAGNTPLTVTASATIDGSLVTRSASVILGVVTGGPTSLFGQVLTVDGAPIPGVELHLGPGTVATDAAGNFFFANVPSGTQKLMVDANAAVAGYPIYAIDLFLIENQINSLPTLNITPPPPPERFTPINNAAADQVITDTRFPGASITLPAGVTITGWDGTVKTKIAMERLSPDRLPVPPPPGQTRSVYQFYFGTPMGGMPSAPLPVSYPNDLDFEPGEQVEIWYFDASPLGGPSGWRKAGMGTVTPDGSRVVSNPGVGLQRFCGACGVSCIMRNADAQDNNTPGGPEGGDPVDLAIGRMIVKKTDMVLPGRFPVTIDRTYNPLDPFGKIAGFELGLGPGWALSVDVVLLEASASLRRMILPGNTRIDFTKRPDGTFINGTHPIMAGVVLSQQTGGEHELRFKDGAAWRFKSGFLALGKPLPGVSLLIQQADRNANWLAIERDTNGRIVRLIDSAGRALSFTSNAAGRITRITDSLGRSVIYSYDASGRLVTVTDPNEGITQYEYNATGGIVSVTDPKGIKFLENFYGASGRVLRQVQADGGEWRFSYEITAPSSSIGPSCTARPLPFTSAGNNTVIPAATTKPPCPTTESWELYQQGYHLTGGKILSTTVRDPNGHATTYRFNNLGYPTEMMDALGQVTRYELGADNQVKSTLDPLGRKRSLTYDAKGNIASMTDAQGNVTRYEYDPAFSRLTKITDALNQVTQFEYDTQGNLIKTTDPLLKITTIAYNGFGQPVSITNPLENVTRFEYDDAGNLTATIDPMGNQTTRAYDPVSRLITLTDPRGFLTRYQYDPLNRVTQIQDAHGGTTQFGYDGNGNLLSVTDAKGQTTTYTYDLMDRLETRTDPLNRTESYQYDRANNLTQFTDRKGQVSGFSYDPLNRRVEAGFADGSSVSFLYDAVGKLTRANDTTSGPIELSYDILDRLTEEVTPQGVVYYAYDTLGRRASMTTNGQAPVNYQYDPASRLTQITQGNQFVNLAYDAAGRRMSLTYPNGTFTNYTYDPASRLTRILHQGPAAVIDDLMYIYDADGSRLGVDRSGPQAGLPQEVQAAYDEANELIQFNSGSPNFSYDANGNLISKTDEDGTTTYAWDVRNRLIGISGPNVTASFVYDALGRRVNRTINGLGVGYLYDGNDVVAEISSNAVMTTYLRSLNIDEPFIRQSSSNEYYHVDALGSTLELSDANGSVTDYYTYEAFGKTTAVGTSTNPFQYTGRENDGTGFYYYRARYFNPSLRRFMSEDPILAPYTPFSIGQCRLTNYTIWTMPGVIKTPVRSTSQFFNAYVYVNNNPIQFNDSSGLFFEDRSCNEEYNKCLNDLAKQFPGDSELRSCLGTRLGDLGSDCGQKSHGTRECRRKDLDNALKDCFKGRNPPRSCKEEMIACINKQ